MVDELQDEELVGMAEMIMAVRKYEGEEEEKWEKGVDIVASPVNSEDKILMRVITEPITKSGNIGATTAREASEVLEQENCDRMVVVGNKFTKEARRILDQEGIEVVSDRIRLHFEPKRLYDTIQAYIDDLCKAKCGRVPVKESDCEGYSDDHYSCKIRLISDNASFHYEHGWEKLLKHDLKRLLTIDKSLNAQSSQKEHD